MVDKGVNIKDLSPEMQDQLRKQGLRTYQKEQVLKASGSILVTLGNSDLPIMGQKEALALVQSWIRNMRG
jgi:hypothetical protein